MLNVGCVNYTIGNKILFVYSHNLFDLSPLYGTLKRMYDDALEIVTVLKKAGFLAYFAGGWVRDFVMGINSYDIDIATSATPEDVIALFKNTVPIGKAFGVVLVVLNDVGYEVASFRKDNLYIDGRRPSSIAFATPEEDASRRDFTINGLFFDPMEKKVHDFVGGQGDIHKKIVRSIGDPYGRFSEDRLRMIRAIRFSSRLGFTIDANTEQAITNLAGQLYPSVSKERVLQELKKMGAHFSFPAAIVELKRLQLLDVIFPSLKTVDLQTTAAISNKLSALSPEVPYVLILSCYFKDLHEAQVFKAFEDLKLSSQEKLDLLFALFCQKMIQQGPENIAKMDWVLFFSHPLQQAARFMIRAMSSSFTREVFEKNYKNLEPAIERKMKGLTLLTSRDLLDAGVLPGKAMGVLLREGEEVAILHDLKTKEEIFQLLQKSPAWPPV